MKNRKEKERKNSWDQVFRQKELLCWDEPSELVYIGILVTSTITGHGGSVVSALSSQAKDRGSFPSCGISFFPTSIFLSSLSNLCSTKRTIHQFGRILSVNRHTHIINTPLLKEYWFGNCLVCRACSGAPIQFFFIPSIFSGYLAVAK